MITARHRGSGGAGIRGQAILVVATALFSGSCARDAQRAHHAQPPLDSKALQARNAEEANAFAAKVAAEPPADRVAVERVAPSILIAPKEHVVYLLDPELVAIDAISGSERWRAPNVQGTELSRAGRYLVATAAPLTEAAAPRTPGRPHATVAWVDPSAPGRGTRCSIAPPAPPTAEEVELFPFDRAGTLYLHWRSHARSWRGGTPPPADYYESREAAAGCGVLAFEVAACTTRPADVPGYDRSHCSPSSPAIVIPAVAASAPHAYAGDHPALGVETHRERQGCEERTTRILRATEGYRVLWSRKLTDLVDDRALCGPP